MIVPYRIAIQLLRFGLRIAAMLGHRKARAAMSGRKGWQDRLMAAEVAARKCGRQGPWFHVHCASLGEFEQAAPVLSAWRSLHPAQPILLTFFSPSGISGASAPEADHIDYLPWDSPGQMRRFFGAMNISDTVLVKYELWPELMRSAHAAGTRLHLVASRFDAGRHPMNTWGGFVRKSLRTFTTVQTQDVASGALLQSYGISSIATGDPRVDRVCDTLRADLPTQLGERMDSIQRWAAGRKVLIVGSAWGPEWDMLPDLLHGQTRWCALVAPHELHGAHMERWAGHVGVELLSSLEGPAQATSNAQILLLDAMGLLKYAYRLGDIALVGGGWGKGVHNTLEPAVYGLPVLCGPNIAGFREIEGLKDCGGLQACDSAEMLVLTARQWMTDTDKRKEAGAAAKAWVDGQTDAASRIVEAIQNSIGQA